jgi:tetratricopeptide (TPR) repeat protein
VFGKRAVVALIAALLAFGYIFTMNPGATDFQLYPGASVRTSFALVLFLFFLAGFGLAVFATAFKEACRSFGFWRHRKGDERREDAQRLFAEGRAHAVLGRSGKARKLLQRAYRKSPEALLALEVARTEVGDGRLDAAERRLKVLLEDDPKNPEVLSLLLEIFRTRRDFEGQVATLSRWLEMEPDHLPSLRALRELYQSAGNWSEAVRMQERVVARTETRQARAAERRTLSELRWRWARVLPEGAARALLERVVAEDEAFTPAHADLGDRLLAAGDRSGAVRVWIRGHEVTGQVGLLLKAEAALEAEGRGEEAVKLYKKLGRKGGAAVLLRARLLLERERPQEALKLLEGEQRGVGSSRAGRLLVAEALFRLRSYDEAARAFREGLLGAEETVAVGFSCDGCGAGSRTWGPTCPSCGGVDTLEMDLGALPPEAPLPTLS